MTRKEAEEIAAATQWATEHTDALEKNWERLVDKARKERDGARAELERTRKELEEVRKAYADDCGELSEDLLNAVGERVEVQCELDEARAEVARLKADVEALSRTGAEYFRALCEDEKREQALSAEVVRLKEALAKVHGEFNNPIRRADGLTLISYDTYAAVCAALSPAPVQKCQWSERGKTCDSPATRIDVARGDPPYACDEHAGELHRPLSPAPSEPKEKHDSLCVPNSEFGCDCYAPPEPEARGWECSTPGCKNPWRGHTVDSQCYSVRAPCPACGPSFIGQCSHLAPSESERSGR